MTTTATHKLPPSPDFGSMEFLHKLQRLLKRARALACDLLAAVPREEVAAQLRRVADCGDENACGDCAVCWETKCCNAEAAAEDLRAQRQRVEIHRDKLAADLCGAEEARNEAEAERDRALDQLQRLETALSAEQAQVAKLRAAETELRELQDQALSRAREDRRALELAARGVCAALEDDLLGPRQTSNLRNLRHVLGMVP